MKRSACIPLCFAAIIIGAAIAASFGQGRDDKMIRHFTEGDDKMMHHVTFEYLPGKQMSGVVSHVFPDGTFLVMPDKIPEEWLGESPNQVAPSYFHVDPRAFLLSDSEMGKKYRAYEEEIISLKSTEWRNPPGELLIKGCEFYYGALELDAVSFASKASPAEKITYFGYSSLWAADQIRSRGFGNIVDRCDKVWVVSEDGDTLRFILKKASEPDASKRNILIQATKDGGSEILYTFPGDHIMFVRHPKTPDLFFASIGGWPDRDSPNADPRWQSVYLFDINDPDNYKIVRYPLPRNSHAPAGDERLYGHSGFFSEDGRFFYALLYGFEEEGGGLWVVDISRENFYESKNSFAQVFPWDHALTFFILPKSGNSPHNTVIMTGKEVKDNFAMTLNALTIKFDGLESKLVRKERLIKMAGWNPVPFAYQRISDGEIRVYIETYLNFESEIVPRVKGVYIAQVSTR